MNSTAAWSRYGPYILLALRIVSALLFLQHGAQKLWGFTGSRAVALDDVLVTQRGIAGLLETIGPALLMLGLFTRATAFILCGEMAVAYFMSWAPLGFWPISNGGEEAVLFCYFFLWLVAVGPGPISIDAWLERRSPQRPVAAITRFAVASEPYARALMRIIVGFLITLHGARKAFGVLAIVGGRQGVPPLALDGLPPVTGWLDLVAGVLLMVGLWTRGVALALTLELLAAYIMVAAPRGPWPIRNGGGEALLHVAILLFFAVAGAGAWSFDRRRERRAASGAAIGSPAV